MPKSRTLTPYTTIIDSPVGPIGMVLKDKQLIRLTVLPEGAVLESPKDAVSKQIVHELHQYFNHAQHVFQIDCHLRGTAFQQAVWKALQRIPVGETRTYGEIAKALKTGPRAVGQACRTNPIFILVPCHRVVAAQGLGGYSGAKAGQWMEIKKKLLRHEESPLFPHTN